MARAREAIENGWKTAGAIGLPVAPLQVTLAAGAAAEDGSVDGSPDRARIRAGPAFRCLCFPSMKMFGVY